MFTNEHCRRGQSLPRNYGAAGMQAPESIQSVFQPGVSGFSLRQPKHTEFTLPLALTLAGIALSIGALGYLTKGQHDQPTVAQAAAAACLDNPGVNHRLYRVNGFSPDVIERDGIQVHNGPGISYKPIGKSRPEDPSFIGIRYITKPDPSGLPERDVADFVAFRMADGRIGFVYAQNGYLNLDSNRTNPNGIDCIAPS